MSQFLTHLIASSRGTAEVIQPRLPAMFEPYRHEGGGTGVPPGLVAGRDQHTSNEDAGERGERTYREALVTPAQTPMGNIRATRTGQQNPPAVRGEITPNLPPDSDRNGGVPAASGLNEARAGRGVGEGSRPYQPSTPSTNQAMNPPATVPPFAMRPPILPRTAPARPSSAAAAPAPPPIEVTIGRVEVRAVFPDAPARRSQPARTRPTVSLDDYLKRSGERGQR